MPTSAAGNKSLSRATARRGRAAPHHRPALRAGLPALMPRQTAPPFLSTPSRGFTLLELMVVISIMAIAAAGVSLSLRDSGQAQLEREAERLAALLESARAQARANGVPVRWRPMPQGFRFEGLPASAQLPSQWLQPGVQAQPATPLVLGPEPLIPPQSVTLTLRDSTSPPLRVATDGLRPFAVQSLP